MSGRYALISKPEAVRIWFGYGEEPDFPPRYNIAPTQPVAVVVRDRGERHFMLMRWGFLPGFVKDPREFPLVVNIRGETAREKPSFRAAFMRRRCLMPADGFYQWRASGKDRRAVLVRRPDRGVFAFAALFETWSSADGSEIDTVAPLTAGAQGLLAGLGERAPVVLDQAAAARWLDPELKLDEAEALLRPPADDLFELVPVGPAVNSADAEGPALQEPAGKAVPPAPLASPRQDRSRLL